MDGTGKGVRTTCLSNLIEDVVCSTDNDPVFISTGKLQGRVGSLRLSVEREVF